MLAMAEHCRKRHRNIAEAYEIIPVAQQLLIWLARLGQAPTTG